jgi:uncharacterized OB-fold protein
MVLVPNCPFNQDGFQKHDDEEVAKIYTLGRCPACGHYFFDAPQRCLANDKDSAS